MAVTVLESLDDVLGPGAEALVATARRRRLLNDVAVGLVRDGRCFVRLFGKGIRLESRFELGSVTKTYTAELLALLATRGLVKLNDPAAKYLRNPRLEDLGADAITLEDLATHTSGLPRLPPGVPVLGLDPYARYTADKLERYVARRGLNRGRHPTFLYSNLGYTLLGYALGNAAGVGFGELLRLEILDPLGMSETALAMGQNQPTLVRGHMQSGIPAVHWQFDVCAPCGGMCSTVGDQLKYLQWLLEDTDRESFEPRADAMEGGRIGLGWLMGNTSEMRRHNGATAGFSSWISVDRKQRSGVVILSNRQVPALVNTMGARFDGCLAGREAGGIGWDYGRAMALVRDPVQLVAAPLSPLFSPVAALPFWLSVPVAGGIAYGAERLFALLSSTLRSGWHAQ
jgi:CubicO group peptidase (beta-lactamase class C family)